MMLSRYFRALIAYALLSLGLLVLVAFEPQGGRFLHLSPLQLVQLAGLGLSSGLFLTLRIWLWAEPDRDKNWSTRLTFFIERQGLGAGLPFLITGWLVGMLYLGLNYFLTSETGFQLLITQLLPLIVFTSLTVWSSLGLEPFHSGRKQWMAAAGLALVLIATGKLLQDGLLGLIERPAPVPTAVHLVSEMLVVLSAYLFAVQSIHRARRPRTSQAAFLFMIAGFFALQWNAYPDKYWPTRPHLALFAPVFIMGLAWLGLLAADLWLRTPSPRRRQLKPWLYGLLLVSLVALIPAYVHAARAHSRLLNNSTRYTDQAEYLVFAKNARLNNFHYTGDHNRMPLYPFLQGLFYDPEMSDEDFFQAGKERNIWLSLVLLFGLAFVFHHHLGKFTGLFLTGVVAFSLYIFKAPYFQAELFYYFLAFLTFVFALAMLSRPGWLLAAGLGITAGLGHLTKASILPGLVLFLGIYFGRELISALAARPASRPLPDRFLVRMGYGLLSALLFAATIFPYARALHQRFGSYFYNVNLTFYVWYDDFIAARAAETEHHFAEQYPAHLAPDDLPGPRKYLREHNLEQIWDRVRFGIEAQAGNLRMPFSVTNFHLSYLLVLGVTAWAGRRRTVELIRRHAYSVAFAGLYFLTYLAAIIWYSPIAPERRFTYGLYLPLIYSCVFALEKIASSKPAHSAPRSVTINPRRVVLAAQVVMFLLLAANIYLVLTERMYFDRYGA